MHSRKIYVYSIKSILFLDYLCMVKLHIFQIENLSNPFKSIRSNSLEALKIKISPQLFFVEFEIIFFSTFIQFVYNSTYYLLTIRKDDIIVSQSHY